MPVHDLKRLAAEVSAQHGIRLDPDDPMMTVVTLNRLIFEQAVAEVLENMTSATREFNQAADKVQVRAGGVLAQEVRDAVASIRREVASGADLPATATVLPKTAASSAETKWLALGVSSGAVLFALGVWIGMLMR
jgi:hypothetical protein